MGLHSFYIFWEGNSWVALDWVCRKGEDGKEHTFGRALPEKGKTYEGKATARWRGGGWMW